jgi:hypothetical protein
VELGANGLSITNHRYHKRDLTRLLCN